MKTNPIKLFADNALAARLWFFTAIILLGYVVIQPYWIIRACKNKERVVIMDGSGTFSISPLIDFEEAKDLHEQTALLAVQGLLSQNPSGFDYPDLLERLFLKEACEKANQELSLIKEELELKEIHQKQQALKIKILSTRSNIVLAQVKGEVIRCGTFENQSFVESLPFKLNLTLARNPNMLTNKRYPLAVYDYEVHLDSIGT